MKTIIILFFSICMPCCLFSQPRGGRDIPVEFRFRFFDKQGNIITPDNNEYEIKIHFTPPSYGGNDSIKYFNGYFKCISFAGAMAEIFFVLDKDTMKIKTSTSHDSIPFLKGNYLISIEYAPLFSITAHSGTRIIKQDWNTFNAEKISLPDTLIKIDCLFWKDYKAKIPLDFTPSIYGILYNPEFSPKIYAWDWNNLYVSDDKGKNWQIVLTVIEPYETPIVSYKNKKTLILFKIEKYQKSINKKPLVYFSRDDGATWKVDSIYTKMGFYFAGFNESKDGFAYAIKYSKEERDVRTIFYITKDGGKKWNETSSINTKFFPLSIMFWCSDTIIVEGKLNNYSSFDGGKTWTNTPKNFKYYKDFGNVYPAFDGSDFTHYLEKIDNEIKASTKLLTINNDWYVYMTATKNVWCISGQSYTLISKDHGRNWKYYYGSTAGTSIFSIIDNKYIFNGNTLFEIY